MTTWREHNLARAEDTPFKEPPKTRKQKLHEMEQEALRLAVTYNRLFSTPDGKIVLDDLRQRYSLSSSIVAGDPYLTHANEGARMVVEYTKEMIRNGSENEDTIDFLE